MRILLKSILVFLAFAGCASAARGDDAAAAEMERQAAFRAEFAGIVDDLNVGSFDKFIAAIDEEDLVGRIFGLRLIDQKVKKQFRDNLEYSFDGMIKSAFGDSKDTVKAKLLGFESRGGRGRAVVRFDLPDLQFNYHEYQLRQDDRGHVIIVDWIDFLKGEQFTDGVGLTLVSAAPGKPAVRKLLDFQNVRERDVFQLTELLKAVRDRRLDRYYEILGGLDERLQSQRVVILMSVQLTKKVRNRRQMRSALTAMAQHYPEEPLYSLMLLDYYFPTRRYEAAFEALSRLDRRLGVEDAAMQARLSAAALVMGKTEDAVAHAEAALALENDLELVWWSLLRAHAASERYDDAVVALTALETRFGHSLGRDALQRDPGFSGLLGSEAYRTWLAARR
jgi:hypothetical protein